ncbi:hypothetical protein KDA00_05940 [Candidatus Saccharibacteria bacterium]|nr:hypothetical protein [Candidatus Saccharibacteria bacterium]
MVLIIHIFIALSSLVYTTLLIANPTETRFKNSYILVAGTLVSGSVLVAVSHAPILKSCVSGLIYTSVVLAGIAVAQRRLAKAEDRITKN